MIDRNDIEARKAALSELIGEQVGVRGKSFERKISRAGRLLPKWVHRDAQKIIEASQLAGNPKLARMIDADAIGAAEARITRHLKSLDPKERRTTARLRLAGVVVFNLLVVFVLFLLVLYLRGLL